VKEHDRQSKLKAIRYIFQLDVGRTQTQITEVNVPVHHGCESVGVLSPPARINRPRSLCDFTMFCFREISLRSEPLLVLFGRCMFAELGIGAFGDWSQHDDGLRGSYCLRKNAVLEVLMHCRP
jgi:hypothetical protein